MELKWMGRYRTIIWRIMRHGNLYAHAYTLKLTEGAGIVMSSLEWQTLECILEYEDQTCNMTELANKIGVPQSNFSKYVKTLVEHGLVARYRKDGNYKDIVLQLTDRGREFYQIRSGIIAQEWAKAFSVLEDASDEELARIALFVEKLSESFDPAVRTPSALVKVK